MLTRLVIVAIAWALLTIGLVAGVLPVSLWPLSMVMVAIGVFAWSSDEVVEDERAVPVTRRQRSALERVVLALVVGDVFGGSGDQDGD